MNNIALIERLDALREQIKDRSFIEYPIAHATLNEAAALLRRDDTWGREQSQAAAASLRMIRDAIGELFGPVANLASEEAVTCVLNGPELHHEAEAIIAALRNVADHIQEVRDDMRDAAAVRDL